MEPTSMNSNGIATEEDYKNLNICVLQLPTRDQLSSMLNEGNTSQSPEELQSDFQKLCTLLNYPTPMSLDEPDATSKLLKFCEADVSIARFIQCLEQIERYDVVHTTKELFNSDIICFKTRQKFQPNLTSPETFNDNVFSDTNSNRSVSLHDDVSSDENTPLLPPRFNPATRNNSITNNNFLNPGQLNPHHNCINSNFYNFDTVKSCPPVLSSIDAINETTSNLKNSFLPISPKKFKFDGVNPTPPESYLDGLTKFPDCAIPPSPEDFIEMNNITFDDKFHIKNNIPLPSFDAFLLFNCAETESDPVRYVIHELEDKRKLKICVIDRDVRPSCPSHIKSMMQFMCDRCNSWLIVVVSDELFKSPLATYVTDYAQYAADEERQVPKIILCVFDDYVLPEEFKCYIHLNFNTDDQCYNPWNNIEIAIMEHKDKTLTDDEIDKYTHQMLELKKQSSISTDESVTSPKIKKKKKFFKIFTKIKIFQK